MSHLPLPVSSIDQNSSQNNQNEDGLNIAKMQKSTSNSNTDIKENISHNIQPSNPEISRQAESPKTHGKNIQQVEKDKEINEKLNNTSKENMANMDDKQMPMDKKSNFVANVIPANNLDETNVMDTMNMQPEAMPSTILVDFPAQQIEIIGTIQPPILLKDRCDSNFNVGMDDVITNNVKQNDVGHSNSRKDLDNVNKIDKTNQLATNKSNKISDYPKTQIGTLDMKRPQVFNIKSRDSIITLDENLTCNESSTDPVSELSDDINSEIPSHLFTTSDICPVKISQTVDRYLDTNELRILLSEMQTSDKTTDTDDLYWFCPNFVMPLLYKSNENLGRHHRGVKLPVDNINSKISSKFEISVESTPSTFSDDGYVDNNRISKKYQGSRQPLLHYLKDQNNIPKIIIFILIVVSFVAALVLIIYFSVRSINIESYFYNGSFIVTQGELFNDTLLDRESQTFQFKSHKYESELNKIFKNVYWGVEDTKIICFGKEKYRVYFEIILNKDKSLEAISSDVFTKMLIKQATIVKSGLFRDIVVDSNSIKIGASKANISQCNQAEDLSSQNQEATILNSSPTSTPTTISSTVKLENTSELKETQSTSKEPSTAGDVSSTDSSIESNNPLTTVETTTKANESNPTSSTSTKSTESNATQSETRTTQTETTKAPETLSDANETKITSTTTTTTSTTAISVE